MLAALLDWVAKCVSSFRTVACAINFSLSAVPRLSLAIMATILAVFVSSSLAINSLNMAICKNKPKKTRNKPLLIDVVNICNNNGWNGKTYSSFGGFHTHISWPVKVKVFAIVVIMVTVMRCPLYLKKEFKLILIKVTCVKLNSSIIISIYSKCINSVYYLVCRKI